MIISAGKHECVHGCVFACLYVCVCILAVATNLIQNIWGERQAMKKNVSWKATFILTQDTFV